MKTLYLVVATVVVGVGGYSHTPVQYHIQTDEGPNRYFRFQTYNGQYRKEKRLDDGTVFGTYGWVDALGVLRLYDYVADAMGYRIVRQRTMRVGVPPPPPTASVPLTTTPPPQPTPVPLPEAEISSNDISVSQSLHQVPAAAPVQSQAQSSVAPSVVSGGGTQFGSRHPSPATRPRPRPQRPHTQAVSIQPGVSESGSGGDVVPVVGAQDLPAGGTFSINYDLGNQFHFEKIYPDGTKVGKHGYVDPLGILRVSHYTSGPGGHTQRQESRWVGTRHPASS